MEPARWAQAVLRVDRDWAQFPFTVVDCFAGAGGSSNGVLRALSAMRVPVLLIQINHWTRAIQTQLLNFPDALHYNASVETLDPQAIIPWLHVDLLVASPECISFSAARGKDVKIRPQSRSSAAFILTWLERVNVARVAIENVREWATAWGRLNAKGTATLKGFEGEYFRAFIRRAKRLGYAHPAWKVLNAADYGSPTSRKRLFLLMKKGDVVLSFPTPTHTRHPEAHPDRQPWRVARDILDFNDRGNSTFARRDRKGRRIGPHSPNSLRRTRAGLESQLPKRPGAAAYVKAYDAFLPVAERYAAAMPPTARALESATVKKANKLRAQYGLPEGARPLRSAERTQIPCGGRRSLACALRTPGQRPPLRGRETHDPAA